MSVGTYDGTNVVAFFGYWIPLPMPMPPAAPCGAASVPPTEMAIIIIALSGILSGVNLPSGRPSNLKMSKPTPFSPAGMKQLVLEMHEIDSMMPGAIVYGGGNRSYQPDWKCGFGVGGGTGVGGGVGGAGVAGGAGVGAGRGPATEDVG